MAKNKNNIIAGNGDLYIADATTQLPMASVLDGTVSFAGWTSIGYTEGIKISTTIEHQEIMVDGELTMVKAIPTKETCEITANLSERDLGTLYRALNTASFDSIPEDSTAIGFDLLQMGGGASTDNAMIFYGTNPEGYFRLWYFPHIIQSGEVTYESSNEHAPMEVTFKCLADTEADPGSKLFSVFDMTAEAN